MPITMHTYTKYMHNVCRKYPHGLTYMVTVFLDENSGLTTDNTLNYLPVDNRGRHALYCRYVR